MSVFKDYSKYYNLLYKDKNYKAEVDYVLDLVSKQNVSGRTILNLGCGTGNHDFIFAEKGFEVFGVDLSEEMIEIAKSKISKKNTISFAQGDIRSFSIDKEFDIVLSLFHVMSYQTTNDDLVKTIKMAYKHLQKGGVFIFDCWYGPGVLTDNPQHKNKDFENDDFKVNRITSPTLINIENCVNVKFNVTITDKKTNEVYNLEELHKMRYLFIPELKYLLEQAGFTLKIAEEWMTKKNLTEKSWYATIVCTK